MRSAFQRSLDKLGLAYIDLYFIHWPVPLMKNRIWKEFEKIYAAGLVRSIGVSNYSINQLETLAPAADIPPAVNQVLFHPFSYKKELLDYCKSKNIALEAYSPLARGRKLNDPVIAQIAGKYVKAPAQIMIRGRCSTALSRYRNPATKKEFSIMPRFSIFKSKTMI